MYTFIGRLSADILVDCWPIYRSTIDRLLVNSRPIVDRYIDRLSASAHLSVNCWPIYWSTVGRYIGPLMADLLVDYWPIVSRLSTDTWFANCVVKYPGLIVGCGRSCFDPFKKEKLFAVLLLCLLIGIPMKQDACLEGQTLAFGLGSPSHVFQCRWVAQFFKEDLKLTNSELYDF